MKVHIAGLTGVQWAICIGVSSFGLIWNVVLKFVPDRICPVMGDETEEEVR